MSLHRLLRGGAICLAGASLSCATHHPRVVTPEPRPWEPTAETYLPPPTDAPQTGSPAEPAVVTPPARVALRDALRLALLGNAELADAAWEVRAAEARALQASLPPNPRVGGEIDEFGGSGELAGTDAAELSLLLSQELLLAGKRAKRIRVELLGGELAAWDYEAARLRVLSETTQRFVEGVAAQERVTLARENAEIARRVATAIEQRIHAGAISPVERNRAQVLLSTTGIDVARAERQLAAARHRLAAMWGADAPTFDELAGALDVVQPVPRLRELELLLAQHPALARWDAELAQRQASLNLARAEAVPNIEVGGGLRYFNEVDEPAFVVEASIPLPLFDRNQGGIAEARARLAQAHMQRRVAEVDARARLAAAYADLAAAYAEVVALREDILPAARAAFDAVEQAFSLGKRGLLDVLDAERTLVDTRGQYIEALVAYHTAAAEVGGLIAQALPEPAATAEPDDSAATPGPPAADNADMENTS